MNFWRYLLCLTLRCDKKRLGACFIWIFLTFFLQSKDNFREKLHLEMWRDREKAVCSSLGKFPTDGGQRSGASLMERNIAKLIKTNYWLKRFDARLLKNILQIYENNLPSALLLSSAQNTHEIEHWCYENVWILDSEAGLGCIYLSEGDSEKNANSLRYFGCSLTVDVYRLVKNEHKK